MKIPNNKVGLVIGKGGETIKNKQTRTGARIRMIPLHLPPVKQANSLADVLGKLAEFGFSSSTETRSFVEELFSKVRHKNGGLNLYQKQEREAALLARKQKTYAILDADDDDDDNGGGSAFESKSSAPADSEPRRADAHKKRFRKKAESEERIETTRPNAILLVVSQVQGRRVKRQTSPDEDDGSERRKDCVIKEKGSNWSKILENVMLLGPRRFLNQKVKTVTLMGSLVIDTTQKTCRMLNSHGSMLGQKSVLE